MTRRLRRAATLSGLMLIPACVAPGPQFSSQRPSVYPNTPLTGPILRPIGMAAGSPSGSASGQQALFADDRPAPQQSIVTHPVSKPVPLTDTPIADGSASPESPAADRTIPVVVTTPAAGPMPMVPPEDGPRLPSLEASADSTMPVPSPAPPHPTLSTSSSAHGSLPAPPASNWITAPASSPSTARPRPDGREQAPEPKPDADGIIRADWPVIRTSPLPLVPARVPDSGSTTGALPSAAATTPVPLPVQGEKVIVPSSEPKLTVIGSSVPVVSPTAFVPESPASSEPVLPASQTSATRSPILPKTADDSPLVQAIRAFQQNQPEKAREHLKEYDPASQQVLMKLMPALVRLTEGKLAQMTPEELDRIVEQMSSAPRLIHSRASLRVPQAVLCREVHSFAHIEPFPPGHTFYPGDVVYLYLELAHFSAREDPRGGYVIHLGARLELLDAGGRVVWQAEPRDLPDRVTTVPQDYYRNFRLCVPSVAPGSYTLRVTMLDRPTGRQASRTVAMVIGSR